jgi:DNA-binding CsgD family transcriptional regulator
VEDWAEIRRIDRHGQEPPVEGGCFRGGRTRSRRYLHPGGRGRRRADRPTAGWESLTSAEPRVVRAIVDGKTNKEAASTLFPSPHTVGSHLGRVFGKLGINTGVELTKHFLTHEAVRELGLIQQFCLMDPSDLM